MSNVYITYQHMDRAVDKAVNDIAENLKAIGHHTFLSIEKESRNDLKTFGQILNKCDLLVAVVSDKNVNLFIEIGYALGNNKKVLLLVNKGINISPELASIPFVECVITDNNCHKSIIKAICDLLGFRKEHLNELVLYFLMMEIMFNEKKNEDNQIAYKNCFSDLNNDNFKIKDKYFSFFDNQQALINSINISYESLPSNFYEKLIYHLLLKKYDIKEEVNVGKNYDFSISNFYNYKHTIIDVSTSSQNSNVSFNKIINFHNILIENNADCGIFITNSNYNKPTIEYCKKKKAPILILWTFEQLLDEYDIKQEIANSFKQIAKNVDLKKIFSFAIDLIT